MNEISIAGLDKAEVLAALYNGSRPLGLGFLHYDPTPMTKEQAQEVIDTQGLHFDYLQGRVMKVNLSEDALYTGSYDRDNGEGAAARIINSLRAGAGVVTEEINQAHADGVKEAADILRAAMGTESTTEDAGDILIYHLGIDDMSDILDNIPPAN